MKVVFATYDRPDDVGGVSTWLQRLLPRLQQNGFDIEVHVFGSYGANCEHFARVGIPFRLSPGGDGEMANAVRICLDLIEESQPDVYVPNCIVPAYFAAGYARRQGLHTIGLLHGDDPFYQAIVDEFMNGKEAFRLSAVVPVSQFLQNAVDTSACRNKVVIRRIGCGVPVPDTTARRSDGVFRLVYTGRLEEEAKCISKVTHSLCAAVKQNPGMEAWIVGEGSARSSVEKIISESGVDPQRVRLLGRVSVSEIYSVLAQCHAFVLLSDHEGLPVSMLEAMAIGVVPVCLDMRSGIREAIRPGVNGLIVKDREADFLANVQCLMQNKSLWAELSNNARETVQREFSEDICAASWSELLGSFGTPRKAPFRSPRFACLPRRNPKFGIYDHRTPPLRKIWNRMRMTAGYYRRKLFQANAALLS